MEESQEFECKLCNKKFGSEQALKQHNAAKHQERTQKPQHKESSERKSQEIPKGKKSYKGYIITAIIIASIFLLFWWISKLPKTTPVDAHWHADYEIDICGEPIPAYPASQDIGIHTHGDGKIHIHPHSEEQSRENANLERFFTSLGGELKAESIKLPPPDGREFKNGDLCNGVQGKVKVIVNGREREEAEKYIPKNGDVVRIVFG